MEKTNFSESNRLFDHYLKNIENIMETPVGLFLDRIGGIQTMINSGKLKEEENNRLRLLGAYLSFLYYDKHFYDKDYYDKDQYLLAILENVGSNIDNMSDYKAEGDFFYWMSNLYSVIRFSNTQEDINKIWNQLRLIDLSHEQNLEFDINYMNKKAKEVYDRCKSQLTYGERQKDIYNIVKAIVMESLRKEEYEVDPKMLLRENLEDTIDYDLENSIRERFEVSIPNFTYEEIEMFYKLGAPLEDRIDTVGDLVKYIELHSEY